MSIATQLELQALIDRLRAVLPAEQPVYLVGGAVRDLLSGRPLHDLDFALPGDALALARRVADSLGAAYYPLDEERGAGRVLLNSLEGERLVLDFSVFRGENLTADLCLRDLTMNAMALKVDDLDHLIDPLGGAQDLREKQLRAASPASFQDDPIRIWRAVRQAVAFGFKVEPRTRQMMKDAAGELSRITPERMRDELFRILDGPQPAQALRVLEFIGALDPVLPELLALKGVDQSPPHISDVWSHTLAVVAQLEIVLNVLGLVHNPEAAGAWARGLLAVQLGRYRQSLDAHLSQQLNPNRSRRSLLFMAALYHDIGKPATRQVDSTGRIRFFEHERVGAMIASTRLRELQLSNEEVAWATTVIGQHMRPLLLMNAEIPPTRRSVYRLFRDTGAAGVDVCLLSLADSLATYGAGLPREIWASHLEVVQSLFNAWWEHPVEQVSPPALLNGHDLIQEFKLQPGRRIGELLEMIREAQVTGQVQDRQQAIEFVQQTLASSPSNE